MKMNLLIPAMIAAAAFLIPLTAYNAPIGETPARDLPPPDPDSWMQSWQCGMFGYSTGVALDGAGNVYVTGACDEDGTDFDPGPEEDLHDAGAFLCKYTESGEYEWAVTWPAQASDVAADESGNVYVSGDFEGETDFDPGAGTEMKVGGENGDGYMYLSKFSSSGDFEWVRTWGGIYPESAGVIQTDDAGNIHVYGQFIGDRDFDPGDGVDMHEWTGGYDLYLTKFDASGNHLWTNTWGGEDFETPGGLDIDRSGNVYVCGAFYDVVDFDPGSGTQEVDAEGSEAIFISVFDSDGNLARIRTWACEGLACWDVAVDENGIIYLTGEFRGRVHFDSSNEDATVESQTDGIAAFLLCLDTSLDVVRAKGFSGDGNVFANGVACGSDNVVRLIGNFRGAIDFDPGSGTVEKIESGDGPDCYMVALDGEGEFIDVETWGHEGWEYLWDIELDSGGYVYVTGEMHYTLRDRGGSFDVDDDYLMKIPPF